MTAPKQDSGLQISADMAFQRRTWLVERVGWVVLGAILIAALLGFFGGGGVVASADVATEDGSLSMHYERFWRVNSPTQLRVLVRAPDAGASAVRLWLGREYVEALAITSVTPQPDSVEAAADRFVFEFPVAQPAETVTILFNIEPRKAWKVPGRAGVDGGEMLSFNQFIYP